MREGWNVKALAKIQVSAIFQMLILGEMIYPNSKSFVGDTMLDRH